MRRIEPVGVNHRAVCAAALVIGPNPSFRGAPPGRRSAPPEDRLRASPESITTTGSMDSGQPRSLSSGRALRGPVGGFRNDKVESPVSRQKFQRLLARREAAEFAIVGIVLRGLRRPEHDEFL